MRSKLHILLLRENCIRGNAYTIISWLLKSKQTLRIILLLIMIASPEIVKSQAAASFNYTTQTGTLGTSYSWIDCSTGTTIVTGDDEESSFSWPFEFSFYDNTYTTSNSLSVATNGFIRLDGIASTDYDVASAFTLSSNSTELGQIIATSVNDCDVGEITSSWVNYLVTGSSPNRILTLEYNDLEIDYQDNLYADVQVSFYETSNLVVLKLGADNVTQAGADMGIHSGVAGYFNKWQEVQSGTNNTWIEYSPPGEVNATVGFDYLKSVTSTGSGTTTDNSKAWTDLFSITIDLGSNTADTKYVMVTASINMRPDGTHDGAREGNYNIYRSDLTSDESGIIKRQIKANTEANVESWGIGTLVHIFDVSGLSGSKTYTLEHSNQGGSDIGRNVYSSARLTAVALSTATNHYELSNDVKRIGETGVTTTSATYAAVTGLTTDAITLAIKGDIYVTASVNGKANGSAVAEYKLEYSSDGGGNWADLGKPIKRSMINTWDDGIVSLVGLLQDQDADNDFKFRVAHKRESGTATVTTHNCNLVAVALAHDNGGSFPAFYSEVDATGVDITGLSTPAATVTSTTFTASGDINSTGTNLFVNSQYLVSASNLDGIDRMRAGNILKVSGASSSAAEEYYRYIPDNANFGAGGFIGLMEDLVSNGSYTVVMDHQIAAISDAGGSGDETLNTSEVILTGFQTYDQYPVWNGSTNTDFSTASNWSNNIVPSSGSNLFFADDPDNSCYLDTDRTIGAIVINQSEDTLVINGYDLTINGILALSNGGQIDATTDLSTVILESSLSQSIPDGAFYNNEVYNLTVNNSNNIQVFGTLRILNSISASSGRLDVTTNSSTVVYAGTSAQTIESSTFLNEEFYNLTIDNSAGVALNADFTINNDLLINSGLFTLSATKNLSVTGTITNSAGNSGFILNSDATGTSSLIVNSFTGNSIRFNRYIPTLNRWHIISSPLPGQSIASFLDPDVSPLSVNTNIPTGDGGVRAMTDFIAGDTWNSFFTNATSGNLSVAKGFLTRISSGSELSFVGSPVTSNQTPSVTADAFNCVGNPFTSSLSLRGASGFLTVNEDNFEPSYEAIYVWNEDVSDYSNKNQNLYVPINLTSGQEYIQPGQGFLVRVASAYTSLAFNVNMRAHQNGLSFYKSAKAENPKLSLEVETEEDLSTTDFFFLPEMTYGLDPGYDAGLFGANDGLSLYSRLIDDNGVDFMIQCLPNYNFDQMEVPLGLDCANGGIVSFSAETIQLPSGCGVFIEDRQLGIFTDLGNSSSSYSVDLDSKTSGIGRFYLHLAQPISEPKASMLSIYVLDQEIFVKGQTDPGSLARLMDLSGRIIKKYELDNTDLNILPANNIPGGIYILQVYGKTINEKKKLFIK